MSTNILSEYLVALGFKIDGPGAKKGEDLMDRFGKRAHSLGKVTLSVAAAAQTMVAVYSLQMEKLYYASKRSGSMASSIKAMEYGAAQIGLSGAGIRASIEGMARALRSNPGLEGVLASLGVEVKGRDMSDVMLDMVESLKRMPPFLAEKFAAMFGMDADTLFQLTNYTAELKAAMEAQRQMASESGVDVDNATEAGKAYAQQLREIWERMGLLKDATAIWLLPAFTKLAEGVNWALREMTMLVAMAPRMSELRDVSRLVADDWERIANSFTTVSDLGNRLLEGLFGKSFSKGGGVQLSADSKARLGVTDQPKENTGYFAAIPKALGDAWDRIQANRAAKRGGASATPSPGANGGAQAPSGESPEQLFARLEQQYKLPAGLLDKIWAKESARGKHMLSKAGAKGHFQFMDATAKDYGLKDPDDLAQSAEAASKYLKALLKMFDGDLVKAVASYNWGQGNVMNKGLGAAPAETRDYVKAITGATINQTNNITITGAGDPKATADSVTAAQRQTNADLVRHLTPRVE